MAAITAINMTSIIKMNKHPFTVPHNIISGFLVPNL
jgi:hypothetical protein